MVEDVGDEVVREVVVEAAVVATAEAREASTVAVDSGCEQKQTNRSIGSYRNKV